MTDTQKKLLAEQTVLVVDDNAINREFLCAILDGKVAEIRTAQDGPAALESVGEWSPSLVLMDLHMPGMDGLETWRRMQAVLDPAPYAVVLTADWRSEEQRRLLDAGFDAFLGKPVDSHTLIECLQHLLSGQPWRRDAVDTRALGRSDAGLPILDDRRALAATNRDPDLVRQMRELLLDDLSGMQDHLDGLLRQGAGEPFTAIVHRIKGGCGYAGAARLEAECSNLERPGTLTGSAYLQLVRTLQRTQAALEHNTQS